MGKNFLPLQGMMARTRQAETTLCSPIKAMAHWPHA